MSIVVEHHNGVQVVRINRPEAKNAINPEVAHGIDAAFQHAATDPAVRVAVLTGTGDAFSAGVISMWWPGAGRSSSRAAARLGRCSATSKLITAANGTAVAGGFGSCWRATRRRRRDRPLRLSRSSGLFAAGGGR
jgi:enoyl-CoA hydratase